MEERYSGRFFEVEYVFKNIEKEESTKVEMEWYYELDSWDNWKTFLCAKESKLLKYPKLKLLNAGRWNKIGFEEE